MCPAVIPGLHPYKQAGTFSCRLRCGADAYRRGRHGKAEEDEEKDRAEGSSREQVAPHELDALLLKKHRFWNTTGIESRSEDELASLFADGGEPLDLESLIADGGEDYKRPVPTLPTGNPCAWPSEWDGSRASKKEMYVCLESCPVGSFFGVCLHPCFLEIIERRCREKRAKETKPEGGEHLAAEAALNPA
ncbi:hypothetical protein LZ30DRAFT_717270 [Colletotrichum cereale]|nr:hypothetical protein LZ30DRAFT_717270 [Colletotrichum cereale]